MIAVDSSVLIDVLTNDPANGEASMLKLQDAMERDDVVICEAVLAEVASQVEPEDELLDALAEMGINFSPLTEQAAARAGFMQRRYRGRNSQSSNRPRVVADFLVGAHALMQCNALITRDASFFRDYFKGLKIINPGA
jgi:predicted nucleic acid-binding protein